jgi:hypothetical protein
MDQLTVSFEERLEEIEDYLQLLAAIEMAAQSGIPRLGSSGHVISTRQQRVLYSGVFLQLYNLVESTVVSCLNWVTEATLQKGTWMPGDLNASLQREWVRVMARTHVDMTYESRLDDALGLCRHLVDALPIPGFSVERGGGGNWDDDAIEKVVKRLGFTLQVDPAVYSSIKRKVRNDFGPLGLVKDLRNKLAHGSISFAECGDNVTVSDLRDITNRTAAYMRQVVRQFVSFVDGHGYLIPEKRPADAA